MSESRVRQGCIGFIKHHTIIMTRAAAVSLASLVNEDLVVKINLRFTITELS